METMAVLARTAPPLAGTGHRASTAVLPSASLSFAGPSSRPRGRFGLSAAGTGRAAGARRSVPLRVDASSERNEVMQKQLEGLSFLDKRKGTKPKLATDQVPSISAVPPDADQVIVPVQQQRTVVSPIKPPPGKSTKRIAPVPRRARARGALLQDTEENGDDE